MKKFLLQSIVGGFLLFSLHNAYSQSTCTQTLRTARGTYDQGRLQELPGLLESCLRHGFTTQEKVEAYKLLTLAYIYLEEPAKADEAMLLLLHADPYFQVNTEVDPAEFIALYNLFRTNPIFRVGINLGVNATQPNVVNSIEAVNGVAEYAYKISFQSGLTFEIPLNNKFTLHPVILFQQKGFEYSSKVVRGTDEQGLELVNTSTGFEKQTWISLPVTLQYQLKKGRYNPYVAAGFAGDYLLNSEMTIEKTRDGAAAVPEKSVDLKPQRENINLSAVLAAGAKLKMFGGYFTAEARFQYGLFKINSEATAYDNQELVFTNGYTDSIYKLNSVSVSFGYVQNIFKPKKCNRKK